MPGNGWRFITAVTKLSNDYGAARVLTQRFGRCETCDSNYMLRAGVGIENYQLHTFDCLECELPILVAVRSRAPQAYFEAEENFYLCSEIEDDYTVINLHPK